MKAEAIWRVKTKGYVPHGKTFAAVASPVPFTKALIGKPMAIKYVGNRVVIKPLPG